MASKSHEAEIEMWATVFGLSNKTVDLAKQLLQRIISRKVYSISKPLLALYAASIMSREYIPLTYFITELSRDQVRVRPKLVRHDLKKHFGIELPPEKLVEIETRGFCRVLKLDTVLCEAAVCTAVNTLNDGVTFIFYRKYVKLAVVAIRFVARYMHKRVKLPSYLYKLLPGTAPIRKTVVKYVGVCVDKTRTVARQLQ